MKTKTKKTLTTIWSAVVITGILTAFHSVTEQPFLLPFRIIHVAVAIQACIFTFCNLAWHCKQFFAKMLQTKEIKEVVT